MDTRGQRQIAAGMELGDASPCHFRALALSATIVVMI